MMTHHSNLSERDLELLSAYLDGELSDYERHVLEQRLARESDLRRALDDLRATVRLVSALPRLKAPRSFALDPAIHGARVRWWRRWLASGAALQWSGALGAAASVILITLGLALGSGGTAPDYQAAAPAPAAALLSTPQPSLSAPALFDAAPLAAGESGVEANQTLDGEAAEAPAEAPEAMLAAPEAALPVPPVDAAAQPFAGTGVLAPPATLSPGAAPRSAASLESAEAQASTGAEADRAGFIPLTATPTPAAAQFATPTAEQAAAAVTEDEAASAAGVSQKAQEKTASESGLRWWLVGAGAAGLALSAALFVHGRRQAGV